MVRITRRFICTLALLLLGCASTALAQSGAYPNKPVRFIVPVPPSGGSDPLARLFAAKLSAHFNQSFVVENISGAAGQLAVQTVAKSPPDGYTLFMASSSSYNGSILSGKFDFDARKAIVPVGQLTAMPSIISVNTGLPIRNLADLQAYYKKNPSGLNFASSGIGSSPHLVGELVNQRAGIKMQHIPYKGIGPGILDVIAGRIEVVFASPSATGQYARAGKIRPIAVTSPRRLGSLPDVPTLAEQGLSGFNWVSWFGIMTTGGSPRASIVTMNKAINDALAQPDVLKAFSADGSEPAPGTPEEFKEAIDSVLDQAQKIIKELKIPIS
jgi:tripartite-type tricarboxylate transporter receptor subunit TctC